MKKTFLLLIFAALALANCKKSNDVSNDIDNSASIKPKMVISEYEADNYEIEIDTSYTFYNGNKIDSILSTHGKTTYEYSTNDIIIKYYRENDQIPWNYSKYLYDINKRVVKVEFYYNVNSDYHGWTGPKIDSFELRNYYYKYDYLSDGSVKEQFLNTGDEDINYIYWIYKYDTYGNVVTKITYLLIDDLNQICSIDSLEYDNKDHYLKNVEIPTFATLSSKVNNITKIKSTFYSSTWDQIYGCVFRDTTYSVTTQTYQYDNIGFPTKMKADGNSHTKSLMIKY